jgi:LCP family protein required for cell wall assembly
MDSKPAPRRNRNRTLVTLVLGVSAVALTIVLCLMVQVAGSILRRIGGQLAPPAPIEIGEVGGWAGTERVNVLLLGIDQRPNENPATARTDTMIVLTLDPISRTAGMMSIPRDLYVTLPERGQGRINTAHVYGGAEYAMRTVENNFGIKMHHHMRVNFNALITIIDLAGGIEIDNPSDINDQLYPDENYGYDPFTLPAGKHMLDGKTALKYARTRHGDSDFYRIRRQQQVIMALREKITSGDAVTKVLPNAPAILETLNASIDTDLSNIQLVQLLLLAKDIPKDRIARVVIDESAVQPWTTPQGGSVVIPIRDRLNELREQLYQPVPAGAPLATLEPARVAIENGTQTRGLAANARTFLQNKGYSIVAISDAQETTARTRVINKTGKQDFAARLARDLDIPGVVVINIPDAASTVDVIVLLGDDYTLKP